MARILVNYIYNKSRDEYELMLDSKRVYADVAVAVLETEEEINKPLVISARGVMVVVDRDRYEAVNKKFYLVADEKGNVMENPNGTERWLPKDTDISKLKVVNGQLVLVEDKPEKKEEKPTKNNKEKN